MLKSVRHSLITRQMIYFMITGVLFMVVFAVNFLHGLKVHFQQEVLPNIAQYLEYVVEDIGTPPDVEKARQLSAKLSFSIRIEGRGLDWQSHQGIPAIRDIDFQPAPVPYEQFHIERKRGRNYVLMEKGDYRYLYVIGRPFGKPFAASQHRQQRSFILIGFSVLALVILFLLIRSSLKPMEALQQGVRRIAQGDLDSPIAIPKSTEFSRLAHGINDMAGQIKSMLESKRELLLAISHELRSPLTRAKVNLALIPESEIQQALLYDCNEMEQLVSQILESERLNQKHAALHITRFSLDELIRDVVDRYLPDSGIGLDVAPVRIAADSKRITLLVKNLLDNAVKYSAAADKAPVVSLTRSADQVLLQVEDWGQGMKAEELDRITRAFYRVDPGRARSSGGVGLGLYLCDLVVKAHRGNIQFSSQPGKGTRVSISLPLQV